MRKQKKAWDEDVCAGTWVTTRAQSEWRQRRAGREQVTKVFANHVKWMRLHFREKGQSLWVVSQGMAGSGSSSRNGVGNGTREKEAGRCQHKPVWTRILRARVGKEKNLVDGKVRRTYRLIWCGFQVRKEKGSWWKLTDEWQQLKKIQEEEKTGVERKEGDEVSIGVIKQELPLETSGNMLNRRVENLSLAGRNLS